MGWDVSGCVGVRVGSLKMVGTKKPADIAVAQSLAFCAAVLIRLWLWLLCDHDTCRLAKCGVGGVLHLLRHLLTMLGQSTHRVNGACHGVKVIFYSVERPF
jgi:hypothetical protein